MKTEIRKYVAAALICLGMSSCSDFFEAIPGKQFGLEETFASKQRTEQYLNNVYSYIREVGDVLHVDANMNGAIFTEASLEGANRWNKTYAEWTTGAATASYSQASRYFTDYYQAIAKASTFIQNVDKCQEVGASVRGRWKEEARVLRAYYYFELLRIYGPVPLIGEDPIPLDASKEELIKVRNSVDECVEFIANELQKAIDSGDLPNRVSKNNLGRMDVGICKALKAKLYLYWASPLFNGNTDMASVKNLDGKQLFPQTEDPTKWNKANEAYKEFFNFAISQNYGLTKVYTNGKLDPYKSCRAIAAFYTKNYDVIFNELIMVKLRDQWDYTYWTCPKFSGFEDTSVSGGGGYYTTQETVDMFFTKNGLTIDRDPSYNKFEGVPSAGNFTSGQCYDENDTELKYFDADNSYVLKQWKDREARFYVNVTYNGSIWLNHGSQNEEHRTDFTNGARGTCGKSKASGDCPDSGYLIRKGAKATEDDGSKMFSPTLRVADMILGYAETLCMCDDLEGALLQLNQIRERAGIPEYSFTNEGGKVFCPKTKNDLLNRIRRERIVELAFEWNRFFDVRRWKVAEGNNDPDHWIYPEYHKGGEGGNVYGMNMDKDYPDFFARTLLENRANFSKKQYFMPIPYDDIRRIPELVQNLGW